MKKKIILGAGISGLAAAINLRKAGYEVEVYEKNKDVGMRFHGDVQGFENWSEKKDALKELKEMNININFDNHPVSRGILMGRKGNKELCCKKPIFYLVKRGPFPGTVDYGLKEQALKLGINIHFGKTLAQKKVDIIATGPIFKEVPAVDKGIVFKTKSKDLVIVAFGDDLAFKGYSYLLITKGYGCMCTAVFDKLNKVSDCFEKTKNFFIKKFHLSIKSPKIVGGVGSFSLKHPFRRKYKKKNILYVGEAAGLQDFLWGFGMRFAVESGYFAAQSIINNLDYEKIAEEHFRNRLKASMVNRYLWEKFDKKAYSFIINHPRIAKECLHSMYNYNLIQKILFPIAESYLKKKYPKLKL